MENKTVQIMQSVYARNEELADALNHGFTDMGIFTVNLMGAPGVGKTSTLKRLVPLLAAAGYASRVIEGDIESDIDTKALRALGIETIQLNTGGACHLDAPQIGEAAAALPLSPGFLWIENIGNLVCPAEFMIGEHIKLLVTNVTEGSDKPYKYPLAFEKADIILINKWDLIQYVDFDAAYFEEGVRRLNPTVPLFRVSGQTGEGMNEAAQWLIARASTVISK